MWGGNAVLDVVICSADAVSRSNLAQLQDMLIYFDADVAVTERRRDQTTLTRATDGNIEIVPARPARGQPIPVAQSGDVRLLTVPDKSELAQVASVEQAAFPDRPQHTYLLSPLLSVEVSLTRLKAELAGKEGYEDALERAGSADTYTHLTTKADPGYRSEWDKLTVHGCLPAADEQLGSSEPSFAHLELRDEGVVSTTTREPRHFGLQALSQVGRSRAETLREAGYERRRDVANAEVFALRKLDDFGRKTAETVIKAARAFADGEVIHDGSASLPNREPVFIDIETDGLNPTMIWLIGVLDREGGDQYMSFISTDPDERGAAVEAFMQWFAANAVDRPVVAYNGENFDFPHLHRHIKQYCPQYLDDWEQAWTVDPLLWAVTKGNATLPGRTNKLEDVAPALGWEVDDTGLSGAAVGRLFQRYMDNPCPTTELDWERHKRYCEDDVRSMAFLYDTIKEASPLAGSGADSPNADDENSASADGTAQGQLTDF